MSSEKDKLESIRTDYIKGELCIDDMLECPGAQLKAWVLEAEKDGVKDSNSFSVVYCSEEEAKVMRDYIKRITEGLKPIDIFLVVCLKL